MFQCLHIFNYVIRQLVDSILYLVTSVTYTKCLLYCISLYIGDGGVKRRRHGIAGPFSKMILFWNDVFRCIFSGVDQQRLRSVESIRYGLMVIDRNQWTSLMGRQWVSLWTTHCLMIRSLRLTRIYPYLAQRQTFAFWWPYSTVWNSLSPAPEFSQGFFLFGGGSCRSKVTI